MLLIRINKKNINPKAIDMDKFDPEFTAMTKMMIRYLLRNIYS